MTATLRWSVTPGISDGRRLVLECRHGTTTVDVFGPERLTEAQIVRLAIVKHETEETCGCVHGIDTLATENGRRA